MDKNTKNSIKDIIKKIITCDWMSKKFFIRLFLTLIAIIIIQKITGVSYISDEMTGLAMGFITSIIGLYTWKTK